MPIGETRVDHFIHAQRILRVGYVEQNAIAGAGAGRQADFREGGDVVALIGDAGALGVGAMVAAFPEPGGDAGFGVGKDERPIDDPGPLGGSHGNLDHVDAEQRRFGILERRLIGTAGKFIFRAHRARAGTVNVDVAGVVRVGDHGVGVGAAAGLHRADLLRQAEIAHVENADAAEALFAFRFGDALQAAVEPAPGLFHRHDQQIADDGNIALSAGADHRTEQLRYATGLLMS